VWEWVVGVGETVEMDSKGRVTIPTSIRKVVAKSTFRVELMGKDAIVLRASEGRRDLVEKVKGIKLTGDRERACVDAATVRDYYGGTKH
jgi:DNA-binding transcriptional regulator/RsmH inhibitor MraZ